MSNSLMTSFGQPPELTNDLAIPRVGVGVITRRNNTVLIGKRRGKSAGTGSWQFTGGKLELFESVEECAVRETLEEAGVEITNVRPGPYTNDFFPDKGQHYVTLFVVADWLAGEARVLEPEKCDSWIWASWNSLPTPLFTPITNLLLQNFNPFEF